MQTYKVLAVTNGIEREVPQSAIGTMSAATTYRVVLTKAGRKWNEERRKQRAKEEEQEKEVYASQKALPQYSRECLIF